MPTAAESYLDETPMRALLGIPPEVIDEFLASAYQLYRDGRYSEAEIVCRGVVAADHRYWYPYTLYAATLQKMGRFREALAQVDQGLKYEPGHPQLIVLRDEIVASAARLKALAEQARSLSKTAGSSPAPQEMV
jgi:tetratricopeptide (TPR) repeat protein